ncbi:MAG TPA: NAD(P)-dependent alcohol dehydrogenase [Gaiellaceae bacterium]|jgi:NADPH:quinone reductase-like Zn-dependent oxidoreductase|nr:NAD(P)-dependent alcohol dehydrogenase [Gaiellaceae bacterium]
MKAVVAHRYGPAEVLHIEEVPRPVPAENEVLVKVRASTVTRSDCGFRAASPFISRFFTGLRRPKQPVVGMEFAGVVEEVGPGVTQFAVGDEVFGLRSGANAEYVCVREAGALAHKPSSLTFEEAAALPDGASIARAALAKVELGPDTRIVVYGATGAIGTAGVQLAKATGAHVTAVANTKNVELVRSLGADVVLDWEREDFTARGETYDVIFDAVGKLSFRRCKRSLTPHGAFITTDLGFVWHVPLLVLWTRFFGKRRVFLPIPSYTKEDVLHVRELVEAGKYRPVLDRTYPLEDVVDATRYVEAGQKTGNVVLSLNGATR